MLSLRCALAAGASAALIAPSAASADAPSIHPDPLPLGAQLSIEGVNCISGRADPGTIEVKLSGSHGTRTATMDPCAFGRRTRWSAPSWLAELIDAPHLDWPLVRVTVRPGRSSQHRVRYRVSVAGALVEGGTIGLRDRYVPARRVWQGTDQFVNYCVRRHRPLISSRGWLFCNQPAWNDVSARVVPD